MFQNDDVADHVAPTLATRRDVVRFRCWVGNGPDDNTSSLYLDSRFTTWLEVPDAAIVSQVQGLDHEGASMVWISRDVIVKRCEVASALQHAILIDDEDPAGGRYPKRGGGG